ncbi:hypothetical protein HMPREF1246_0994 [Acidaminococcus sp. BV3L6]|nr:hypothetical protein HMPREF1246_0994 [Acidaminococcus sp. BV3L6]
MDSKKTGKAAIAFFLNSRKGLSIFKNNQNSATEKSLRDAVCKVFLIHQCAFYLTLIFPA